jgi:hypothetical protein
MMGWCNYLTAIVTKVWSYHRVQSEAGNRRWTGNIIVKRKREKEKNDEQWSTKNYTEKYRLSKSNPQKNGGDMLIINIGEGTHLPRFYVSWSNQCNQWLSHLKLRFLFHRMRGVLELTLPDNVSPNTADRW